MAPGAAKKRTALRVFKQRGFVVQVGALEHVLSGFEELDGAEEYAHDFSMYLGRVLDALDHALASRGSGDAAPASSMLTASAAAQAVEKVSADCNRAEGDQSGALEVIDVFSIPVPSSVRRSKGLSLAGSDGSAVSAGRVVLDAQPESKANMYRLRYELLLEKTLRNAKFTPPASSVAIASRNAAASTSSPYLQLTSIDSLRSARGDCIVLGMLTQLEEGTWFLEDTYGSIELDLSEVETTAGLHTESSFVIAQGKVSECESSGMGGEQGSRYGAGMDVSHSQHVFKVFAMGPPPFEGRSTSVQALGKDANPFGGVYLAEDEARMLALEEDASDAVIVLLSDVFLDKPRVLNGLHLIFEGYLEDGIVPRAVILMGSFLSHPFGQESTDIAVLSTAFTNLGQMLASEFPQLVESCTFVLVPGPNDAGPGNILPRPAMPKVLTEGFVKALPPGRVVLGSNPCRMRYLTQDLVILREDLLSKMIRNCAVKPNHSDTGVMAEHMFKSVVDQCHLCPLPPSSRPTLWAHDHALWLFPAPTLTVIADKGDCFSFLYGEDSSTNPPTPGVLGLNPGSFGTDLSFAVYYPSERRSQACSLDPDEVGNDQLAGASSEASVPLNPSLDE